MRTYRALTGTLILLLTGCMVNSSVVSTITPGKFISPTFTTTATPIPTQTASPTPTEEPPLTIVFYGDSDLKVGEVGRQGEVGFSFVDDLRPELNPDSNVIIANYGGRTAKWGYENLEQSVLSLEPDVVTIWWGMNDLYDCPGIFDRETDKLIQYKLTALINEHVKYSKLQIDALLDRNVTVFVVTTLPVLGDLPWSHLSPNNELIWENDYRCDYNAGLEQLVNAQRNLVAEYSVEQKPVYLVDVWQIYQDHPNTDKMYMDIVHPASQGAELIAEGWLQAFQSFQSMKR